jgi:hypothetical protein
MLFGRMESQSSGRAKNRSKGTYVQSMQRNVGSDRMKRSDEDRLQGIRYTSMVQHIACKKESIGDSPRRFEEDQTVLGQVKTRSVALRLGCVLDAAHSDHFQDA